MDTPGACIPKLLDRMREELRLRHRSLRTEQAYVDWARRYIVFHGKRHPRDMGAAEVSAFLSHLANERHVAASTQNQARAALVFLYKCVLGQDLPWLNELVQARRGERLPVVLTQRELRRVRAGDGGDHPLHRSDAERRADAAQGMRRQAPQGVHRAGIIGGRVVAHAAPTGHGEHLDAHRLMRLVM
jgi:hypothetical protein